MESAFQGGGGREDEEDVGIMDGGGIAVVNKMASVKMMRQPVCREASDTYIYIRIWVLVSKLSNRVFLQTGRRVSNERIVFPQKPFHLPREGARFHSDHLGAFAVNSLRTSHMARMAQHLF